MDALVDEIEPIEEVNKSAQRYGNKSFRTLIDRINVDIILLDSGFNEFLSKVFLSSFGDPTRIDYGTGHELSFIIFVLCALKLFKEETESYAWIAGSLIGQKYLPLCRKIQCKYSLEPAGSHGVWGLDDHQFIPFLLGSSQLIGSGIDPAEMIKSTVFSILSYRNEYLYAAALYHIHRLKTRSNPTLQFHHHSPLLYDISGVATWQKIHEGLRRMYDKEVLGKLPVVQHILFDMTLFKFE